MCWLLEDWFHLRRIQEILQYLLDQFCPRNHIIIIFIWLVKSSLFGLFYNLRIYNGNTYGLSTWNHHCMHILVIGYALVYWKHYCHFQPSLSTCDSDTTSSPQHSPFWTLWIWKYYYSHVRSKNLNIIVSLIFFLFFSHNSNLKFDLPLLDAATKSQGAFSFQHMFVKVQRPRYYLPLSRLFLV